MPRLAHPDRAQLQPDQRALGIGQVADDLAHRLGQIEARRGDILGQILLALLKAQKDARLACSSMPRTRNCIPISVFPLPEPPQIRVGRPRGKPPLVTSSRPRIPVGHLANVGRDAATALGC